MLINDHSSEFRAVVLLVDDEPAIRKLLRKILEEGGYIVLDAGNGVEGLAVCKTHPGQIDILLSDVEMPELDGHELAVRALEVRPNMKVLFMSGYSQKVFFDKKTRTAEGFLQKPFTSLLLKQAVSAALDPVRNLA